jgi:hypothetical protein
VEDKVKNQDRERKIAEAGEETEMWKMKNKKDDWERLDEGRSLIMREEYLGRDRQMFVESLKTRKRRLRREKSRIHQKWSEEGNLHDSAGSDNRFQSELFFLDIGRGRGHGRGRGRLDHNADFVPFSTQPQNQDLPPSYQIERRDQTLAEPERSLSQRSDQIELLSTQERPPSASSRRNDLPQFSSQG